MKESELGDVVLVDADKNFVSTEYDDLEDLPDEIVSIFFICTPYIIDLSRKGNFLSVKLLFFLAHQLKQLFWMLKKTCLIETVLLSTHNTCFG